MLAKQFIASVVCFLLILPACSFAANTSGLPVPRWVALKSDEVNVRTGPGSRYPIQWVYHRDDLPVEVIEEFDFWRKIRDIDGTTGWVHKSMLEGKRSVMIKAKEAQIMRSTPDAKGRPVLKAEPAVIGRLIECEKDWCRVQLSGRKGWLLKKHLWGVYPDEVFD